MVTKYSEFFFFFLIRTTWKNPVSFMEKSTLDNLKAAIWFQLHHCICQTECETVTVIAKFNIRFKHSKSQLLWCFIYVFVGSMGDTKENAEHCYQRHFFKNVFFLICNTRDIYVIDLKKKWLPTTFQHKCFSIIQLPLTPPLYNHFVQNACHSVENWPPLY